MIQDGPQAKAHVKKWIKHQNEYPPFPPDDWSQLQQVEVVLSKFDGFTQFVSWHQSQISLVISVYYDMLDDAASPQRDFLDVSSDIALAVFAGLKKYKEYYEINCYAY